jgi:hypothetical protein
LGGWGSTVQPISVMCSRVLRLLWGRALSCWSNISAEFLPGQTRWKHFLSLLRVMMYASELMAAPLGITSTRMTSSQSQKTGQPARGRSRSSVSALPDALTLLAHRPTVLLSTAQLAYTAHKRLWMFTTL